MDNNYVKKKLKEYLLRSATTDNIGDDDDLFELGIVHSLFAMQILLFIEKEFDIEIDEDDLDFEKIGSLNHITNLVLSYGE